jgi:hypothetical protein
MDCCCSSSAQGWMEAALRPEMERPETLYFLIDRISTAPSNPPRDRVSIPTRSHHEASAWAAPVFSARDRADPG